MMVGATMLGAVILVGSEDREGALVHAAASVENNAAKAPARQEFNANPQPMRQVQRSNEVIEIDAWAEDADLIDYTSGFDPTSDEFDPADGDEYYLEDEF
ncbi:MAG: hypothetical protein O3C52_04910 [Proteobacteria bacterium]|nr:hypothetical protein [Pseudomonadota bacterium]MDA0914393.1 hypothetical protein [Pseudomonadota bacterium]MDA1032695.1 hypothetical protein [Pseudomonadota bacterium]